MLATMCSERSSKLVLVGGSPKDTTAAAWEQDALSRLDLLERNPPPALTMSS